MAAMEEAAALDDKRRHRRPLHGAVSCHGQPAFESETGHAKRRIRNQPRIRNCASATVGHVIKRASHSRIGDQKCTLETAHRKLGMGNRETGAAGVRGENVLRKPMMPPYATSASTGGAMPEP